MLDNPLRTYSDDVEYLHLREAIERASVDRARLRSRAPADGIPGLRAQLAELDLLIAELWAALRERRVRNLHGARDEIIRRAAADRRLEQELDRRFRAGTRG